ncbi:MAG TPA: glycosyltransferase family 1 protein [Candidatus Angelobacter sp.]|nr:glycosyltransferase family 1 protein [Candidatus Angelobacter sp.]
MRIAIDAHSLGTQSGGNETYIRQLLGGLSEDQSRNSYRLFYTNPAALTDCTVDSRFTFTQIPKNPIPRICSVLPRLLAKEKPDVFHCQYVQPPFARTKTVLSIHDLAHEHFPEFFHPVEALRMKTLVRWSAKRASHIMTISEFSAADISRRFDLPRERITVAYLAASPDFHPRDKGQSQEHLARMYGINSSFILYVGRIQARKNLPRLVEAYARLRKQGLDAKLVMVGRQDWQSEQLVQKIKELGLQDSVIFPGFVPFHDLPIFYNAAEVFVFPSFFEGFGLPVAESMASGLPTITSFGSSLEEVAGNAALLIDPGDTGSITDALSKVLGDPGLQRDLATRGLKRSKDFSAGNLAEKALAVYHSLC